MKALNAYEKIQKLTDSEFKLITGVPRETFDEMYEVLVTRHLEEHFQGGRWGFDVGLRLTLALEYWREYRTLRHMANDHQIPKSTINHMILWVEDVLSESDEFRLKDLKERFKPGEKSDINVVIIDVEEQPVERPQEEQETSYSGKKNAYHKIPNPDKC